MKNNKALLEKLERGEHMTKDEVQLFLDELYRAIREGRVLAKDRPLRIFRVVNEINDEMAPLQRAWKGWATRRARTEVEHA